LMFKKFFIPVLFLLPFICKAEEFKISIGTMFQNDAPYLEEWIEYHRCESDKVKSNSKFIFLDCETTASAPLFHFKYRGIFTL